MFRKKENKTHRKWHEDHIRRITQTLRLGQVDLGLVVLRSRGKLALLLEKKNKDEERESR